MRKRARHAIQEAEAVQDLRDRSLVVMRVVRAVDLKQQVGAAGLQAVADRLHQRQRVDGVMYDVERGDDVKALRQPIGGDVPALEREPVRDAGGGGVPPRSGELRPERVKSAAPGVRKRL